MEITKEQLSEKIHECHMEWANNARDLAKKHGLDWDAQYEFIELVSKTIDHAWAEIRFGIHVYNNELMKNIYYDKYLPIYGPMVEADMAEQDSDYDPNDPDTWDEDEYQDSMSDLANRLHERSEGMER